MIRLCTPVLRGHQCGLSQRLGHRSTYMLDVRRLHQRGVRAGDRNDDDLIHGQHGDDTALAEKSLEDYQLCLQTVGARQATCRLRHAAIG